jgi:hypothetical protein
VVNDSVPEKVYVFEAEFVNEVGKMARDKFRELIKDNSCCTIYENEIDDAIDDGCYRIPETEKQVFIIWPERE